MTADDDDGDDDDDDQMMAAPATIEAMARTRALSRKSRWMISVQPGRLERFQQRHLENNSLSEIIIVAAVITSTERRSLCWTSVDAERADQDRGPRKDPLLDERITTVKVKRHIFRFPKCERRRSCSADRPSSSGRAWKFSRHELFLVSHLLNTKDHVVLNGILDAAFVKV